MRQLHILLISLAICMNAHIGALSAAEFEVIPGLTLGQKGIVVRGPIEEGDDNRFFSIAERTPHAVVLERLKNLRVLA